MATYGMTQPVSHRHAPRNAVAALLLAGMLAVGVEIGRATSPTPVSHPWITTTPLTTPWRAHWIDALNRLERQNGRVETPRGQL